MLEGYGWTEDPWVLPSRGRNKKPEERAGLTGGCGTVRNQIQDSGHDISRTGRRNNTSPVKDDVQCHCRREREISATCNDPLLLCKHKQRACCGHRRQE